VVRTARQGRERRPRVMKIFGDLGSGNCLKVKYTADYLRLPYTWLDVDILKGETHTPQFLAKFPMGRIPAVEFDDGRRLAESNAIVRYLARGSALLTSSTSRPRSRRYAAPSRAIASITSTRIFEY